MKEGDIIEWRGVNKTHRGKVIRNDSGSLSVRWRPERPFHSRISDSQNPQNSFRHDLQTTNPASKIAERETKAVMLGANPGHTLFLI